MKEKKVKMKHGVVINPALNVYEGIDLFPEKTARAKQQMKDFPLPEDFLPKGL